EWVHVQLHQQKGMISLSPPTICNSAFWHGDALESGEVLLGVLLGRDERVRGVYGLLAGAFYMNKSAGC
ncbi:hypothetical protein ACK31X_09235, partial [Aeromonas dhakensis]